MIPTTTDKLARFLRHNSMGQFRRDKAERDAAFAACLARLDGHLEASRTAWLIAAHEAGRADPDPFYERTHHGSL
ncbi:hypothetical protein WG907_04565 [Sphingobium sp. AN558]|uniref:hypothetical protein n=1 Tax=Sphingobium sp. AN558 TaxID=3133442 RepID=UPI0030C4F490